MDFQRDDADIVGGLDTPKADLQMLVRFKKAILQNTDGIRDKAIKGALSAFLYLLSKRAEAVTKGKDGACVARGLRYEKAWKDYALASSWMSPANAAFTRANLMEGAMLSDRQARLQRDPVNFMDLLEQSIRQRARSIVKDLKEEGEELVAMMADEIATMPCLQYCPQLRKVLGGVANRTFIDQDAFVNGKVPLKHDELAFKVKFITVIGCKASCVKVLLMRPGGANAEEEATLNDVATKAVMDACLDLGVELLGFSVDGISKEQQWIRGRVVSFVAASPEARRTRCLGGLDANHQVKSGRNAAAFGKKPAPFGGMVCVAINIFGFVPGVTMDLIHVKDVFGDFRIERLLVAAMSKYGTLSESTAKPWSELLGTQTWFLCLYIVQRAVNGSSDKYTRRHRLLTLHFAVQVLSSFTYSSVTEKNFVTCIISMCFSLANGKLQKPWRWATLMLEYYFGILRQRQNSDCLTVQMLHCVVSKLTDFQKLCTEHNWRIGASAKSYAASWYRNSSSAVALDNETISDGEHLHIITQATQISKPFLEKLGFQPREISPLCKAPDSMHELAATLQALLSVPESREEKEDEDSMHPSSSTKLEASKKTPAELKALTGLNALESSLQELQDDAVGEDVVDDLIARPPLEDAEDDDDFLSASVHFDALISTLKELHKGTFQDIMTRMSTIATLLDQTNKEDGHKGLASKRTILERLMQCTFRRDLQGRPWAFDSIAFVPDQLCFGRVLTVFRKVGTRWLIVEETQDEKKRLQDMRSCRSSQYRITLEVVVPSRRSSCGLCTWVLGRGQKGPNRVFNYFASETYFLPGEHCVLRSMNAFDDSGQGESEFAAYETNISKILQAETNQTAPWADVESNKVGCIIFCLRLLLQVAKQTTRRTLMVAGLQQPIMELKACPIQEVCQVVKDILQVWSANRQRPEWELGMDIPIIL